MVEVAQEPTTKGYRDQKGRFIKGAPGGPGNPHAKSVAACRAAFHGAVTPEAVRKITLQLIARGQEGDVQAIRELFNRLFGLPKEHEEPKTDSEALSHVIDLTADLKRQLDEREANIEKREAALRAKEVGSG